jgi:hypothetical protein
MSFLKYNRLVIASQKTGFAKHVLSQVKKTSRNDKTGQILNSDKTIVSLQKKG